MKFYNSIFKNKKRVLFVTAHPDDIDVFFGGTLALLNKDNKETFVLIVTNGGRGNKNNNISEQKLAKIRKEEEKQALTLLGQKKENIEFLDYLDGEVENNMDLIGKISKTIRTFSPEIICTHEPNGYYYKYPKNGASYINHRDHRNTGACVLDAIYPFSRDTSFFPEQLKDFKKINNVYEILLTFDKSINTMINISNVINLKRKALLTHKSQFDKQVIEEIINEGKKLGHYFEAFNYLKLAW